MLKKQKYCSAFVLQGALPQAVGTPNTAVNVAPPGSFPGNHTHSASQHHASPVSIICALFCVSVSKVCPRLIVCLMPLRLVKAFIGTLYFLIMGKPLKGKRCVNSSFYLEFREFREFFKGRMWASAVSLGTQLNLYW